jgi:serine/threonine protein kinase
VKICPTTSCSLYDFQDGTVFLVRRLPDGQIGEKNLKAEATMLAKVKHHNLMVLRGSFINQGVRLLLYDYMPKGSIASLLQEASKQTSHVLDRPMRHSIAVGIARGISFLHTQCNPLIVHGDVKPNNVLFKWEKESRWTTKTSESHLRGQNSMACGAPYIIEKLLKCRCLKWARIAHLDI